MKRSQLAAQLYTLRDYMKTPADFAGSLEKVREIGYQAVQLSGVCPLPEDTMNQIIKDSGLVACATHEGGKDIVEDTRKVIDHLKAIHVKRTAYPWPHWMPMTKNGCIDYARKLNEAAEKFEAAGLELSYHNHALEFQKFDGELWLDIIYDNAPALKAELDTFWVASGGQDPAAWIKKLAGRQTLLHLKEYGLQGNDRVMRPIGDGNLDWKSIIKAGEKAGIEYFIVEQDNCNGMCPFEALRRSYNYISSNFFA